MSVGVPIKLLHEAQNHVVTVELKTGEIYRGNLQSVEDNMNSQLAGVTVTGRDGRASQMDFVYIRGSHVRFFIIPDMLKNAPMFKKVSNKTKGVGISRGRATVMRAQQKRGGGPGGRGGGPPGGPGGRGGRGGGPGGPRA